MKVEILKKYIVKEGTKADGIFVIYKFPNGYGASVIKHGFIMVEKVVYMNWLFSMRIVILHMTHQLLMMFLDT